MRAQRKPHRRPCSDPHRVRACAGRAPFSSHTAKPILNATRIRSTCRRREDFTGRGFGMARLREVP